MLTAIIGALMITLSACFAYVWAASPEWDRLTRASRGHYVLNLGERLAYLYALPGIIVLVIIASGFEEMTWKNLKDAIQLLSHGRNHPDE